MKHSNKVPNTKPVQSLVGWYGVLAILAAYMLLTFHAITADSLAYQLLNLTGSGGIIVTALAKRDMQPVVLSVIWALVACIAIIRIMIS